MSRVIFRGKRNPWQDWEKTFVFENYRTMNNNELSVHINKDHEQISNFLQRQDLTREGSVAEKNALLKNLFSGWDAKFGVAGL